MNERLADPAGSQPGTAEMILIPAGEYLMGVDSKKDDSPAHKVTIEAFLLDRYEVTNAQYLAFCQATGRNLPEFWGLERFRSTPDFPHHPVVGVSWVDATDYAVWCGKRLPTEAEWEYAARGGLVGLIFPYGDEPDPAMMNYSGSKLGAPVAVGSYPPNGFGLYDMAGNVVEWVADFYAEDYYRTTPVHNPQGPERGRFRVLRGGGWHSGASCCRVHYRNALVPQWKDIAIGFRCARDPGNPDHRP